REPQAKAVRFRRKERIEEMLPDIERNSGAAVVNGDLDVVVAGKRGDRDARIGRRLRGVEGIQREVQHHLLQLNAVAGKQRQPWIERQHELDAAILRL